MSIQTPTVLIGGNNIPASESSRESKKEKKNQGQIWGETNI